MVRVFWLALLRVCPDNGEVFFGCWKPSNPERKYSTTVICLHQVKTLVFVLKDTMCQISTTST